MVIKIRTVVANEGCLLNGIKYKDIFLVNQNVLYHDQGVGYKGVKFSKAHQIFKI